MAVVMVPIVWVIEMLSSIADSIVTQAADDTDDTDDTNNEDDEDE
jgi:hypothetical protein